MDTSNEYIKMCDCPEIQAEQDRYDDMLSFHVNNHCDDIWLPRQDQLQEMLRENILTKTTYTYSCMGFYFYDFLTGIYWIASEWGKVTFDYLDNVIDDISMEQLWLAFVMLEKFNKKWHEREGWV